MPEVNNDFIKIEYDNSTIADIIERINSGGENGIFLPYVQRDFVWKEQRIYSLLDSLMRGYPMGTILIWETQQPINYRHFEKKYNPRQNSYAFLMGDKGIMRQYILDGQQRLQSLYIAMCGYFDGKALFFDLRSGKDDKDYIFEFTYNKAGWINVPDLLNEKDAPTLDNLRKNNIVLPTCTKEEEELIYNNAKRLYDVFKRERNVPLQKISNKTSLENVAKIFMRINSGGVTLDAEDLVMATISNEWINQGNVFNQLVDMIDKKGLSNPKKFIIQACSAVLPDIYRANRALIADDFSVPAVRNTLRDNFLKISLAISNVINFITGKDFIAPLSYSIPFYSPVLILIAYHYALQRDRRHGEWNNRKNEIRAFLFTAFLCDVLKRPTQNLMRNLLQYVMDQHTVFSLNDIRDICGENFSINIGELLDTELITGSKANLIMYLFYYGQDGYKPDMTVKDHIFPKAKLTKRSDGKQLYHREKYDSILNCELLTEKQNGTTEKGDLLPLEFLDRYYRDSKSRDVFLKLHALPDRNSDGTSLLDFIPYTKFTDFLKRRKPLMKERITENLHNMFPNSY